MKKGIILGISMLLLAACSNGQGNEAAASGMESTETAASKHLQVMHRQQLSLVKPQK